jgi:hypothetical protein
MMIGREMSVSAKHYLINELDEMIGQYDKAWERYTI